jgi:hypothetical protein
LLVIVVIVMFWLDRKDQDIVQKEYWENPNFRTDSTEVYIDYDKIPKPEFPNYVPPVYVINYIDSTKNLNNVHLVMNDSLLTVIDSLSMSITQISQAYFKRYPNASKIIYAEFSRDTIRLDLLGIDGAFRQNTFGVNYDRFDYQLRDNEFRASEKPAGAGQPNYVWGIYGFAGYDIKLGSPILGADYSIYKGRLRLRTESYITLSSDTQLYFNANLGYKIK